MQAAVDIIAQSPHSTNKIAATLAGDNFTISRTNHWPPAIDEQIGHETKIGNASGTLHAETACILTALHDGHATQGADIFITDPPCPNCMKNMAESGIKALYIDHKGFDKDFAQRRGEDFENMSMRIAAKAGIDVYVIYRKEERFDVISQHRIGYKPSIENPAKIEATSLPFADLITQSHNEYKDEPFALALTTCGKHILTDRHPTIGYTSKTLEERDKKYSFILQPLNRLLMSAAKDGLILDPTSIYSSRCPTSRELVNFIGAGFDQIHIGDKETARDEYGPIALNQLVKADILNVDHKA